MTTQNLPKLPDPLANGNYPAAQTIRVIYARRLIQERESAGLSQSELARRAGLRPGTINRLEKGKQRPGVATLTKIFHALNVWGRPEFDKALAKADRLLPGKPRKGSDRRWQAILALEDFIASYPEDLWQFVFRWGKHPQADLRNAIACCLLEHLLAEQFALIFPRVCEAAKKSRRFADTLGRCYWIGPAAEARHAKVLDRLVGKKCPRIHRRHSSLRAAR